MRASKLEKDQRLILSRDGLTAWTWLRSIGIAAAVGVVYFLAAELSNSFLITPETVIFWPAAGISSGLLISLWATARWPVLVGVMVATAAANLLRPFDVAVTATWILGNTAEPLIIALLVQHFIGAHFKIDRLIPVLGLFGAAVAGTAVASSWWTFAYYYLFARLHEPMTNWLHWIVSDFAGIASVAPLVIGIATTLRQPPTWRETVVSMAALAVLGVMCGVIVSLPLGLWETVIPAALVFPVLLWLSARWQPVFSAAGAFIVSMSVALTAIYGLGHFADSGLSISARVLQSQAVILVVSFGTAVLAALFAERRDGEAQLAAANKMLEAERERLAHSNMMLVRERDNKLLSLQAVAATINHEVRQPLTALTMNGETALLHLDKTAPNFVQMQSLITSMIADGHRASEIMQSIRAIYERDAAEKEPVALNELVHGSLRAFHSEISDNDIAAQVQLTPQLPPVLGHKGQLQEVVNNLVQNAIEALESIKDTRRILAVRTRRQPDNEILLEIEDTGPGIDAAKSANIFDAFTTTKSNGSGLGLAICQTIVERHNGRISVLAAKPRGCIFQIILQTQGPSSA
jgi:signal transduction histidine kinase